MAMKRKASAYYVGVEAMARELGVGRARVLQLISEQGIDCVAIQLRKIGAPPSVGVTIEQFRALERSRQTPLERQSDGPTPKRGGGRPANASLLAQIRELQAQVKQLQQGEEMATATAVNGAYRHTSVDELIS